MTFDDDPPHELHAPKATGDGSEEDIKLTVFVLGKASRRTQTCCAGRWQKDMKSAITPGRILISRNSRTRMLEVSFSGPKTSS